MKKLTFLFLLYLLLIHSVDAQLKVNGVVTDENDDPLAFTTVYEKGTSNGTTTNENGKFVLELKSIDSELVIQYVGYKSQEHLISTFSDLDNISITLLQNVYGLEEVTIAADAEDPAYRVIRQAISHRKKHLNQFEKYSCDVYIKGNQKILKAPEKILGQDIGDFEGALDSNRQGIVYLSESLAEYYYQAPNQRKEVMVSSKVSGNDSGYSFNSATEMDMNFYKNSLALNREVVSPIADNALTYYKYKLEGTTYDDQGRLINKIKVIPKRDKDPVFSGDIYIIEDLWNLHSLELSATQDATHIYFIDTLAFKQIFVPIGKDQEWAIMTHGVSFGLDFMGLELEGQFTAVYSDYDLDIEYEDDFFGNAVLKVEKEANEKDEAYWKSVRPVPLTQEEDRDYIKRDSISTLRESPAYLDSVDRKYNSLDVSDFIFSYGYRKQKNRLSMEVGSPIKNFQYNTVHGYNTKINGRLLKYYDEEKTKRIIIWPTLSYGLSDKRFRYDSKFEYRFDRLKNTRLGVHGGNQDFQINSHNPISESWNTLYSLLFKKNYLKLYNKQFVKLYGQQEVSNGVLLMANVEYAQRDDLANASETSYFYKDTRTYTSNNPTNPNIESQGIHFGEKLLELELDIRFRIGQKYYDYPDRKFIVESKFPNCWLHLNQGIDGGDAYAKYTHLAGTVQKNYQLGIWGYFQFYVNGGKFLNADKINIIDYKHFRGNQIHVASTSNYTSRFLRMPYYTMSSRDEYLQVHMQHDFEGWIMDKIPALNSLGWSVVAGSKFLRSDKRNYYEFHAGVDNMGFGIFRVIRFDLIWSKMEANNGELGFLIGIKI